MPHDRIGLMRGSLTPAHFLEHKVGREVSTRYVALRGADGGYLGCLDTAQWADETQVR